MLRLSLISAEGPAISHQVAELDLGLDLSEKRHVVNLFAMVCEAEL